jgi:hypothetical protein
MCMCHVIGLNHNGDLTYCVASGYKRSLVGAHLQPTEKQFFHNQTSIHPSAHLPSSNFRPTALLRHPTPSSSKPCRRLSLTARSSDALRLGRLGYILTWLRCRDRNSSKA